MLLQNVQNAELQLVVGDTRPCLAQMFSFFTKSPKKAEDEDSIAETLEQDATIGGERTLIRWQQFAIWCLPEKQNPNAHLQFINSRTAAHCQTALFSFSCLCQFGKRVGIGKESYCTILQCHQSKYRSFSLDFCMHLSNEAQKGVSFKGTHKKLESSEEKPCVFYALQLFFFQWHSTRENSICSATFLLCYFSSYFFIKMCFPALLGRDFFVYFSGWTQLSGRKSKHLESLHLLEIPAKSLGN